MCGSNLNLDADGEIVSVTDGLGALQSYYELCSAQGLGHPSVVVE
jgi:2,4'-dihydroxyacetophenone dioxygenase